MSIEYVGKEKEIKVSVIIPIYNMEKYLPCCLESIICQTLREIEVVAINDGSTDNSLNVLKEYQIKFPALRIINQENQGSGIARNQGIIHSRGKYIAFMDPDDFYISKDCLEALYLAAERENVSMCGGRIIQKTNKEIIQLLENYSNEEQKVNSGKLVNVKDYSQIYGYTKFVFRSDIIKKNNINFPIYRRFQDPIFFVKALINSGIFYEIDKDIYVYRVGYKKTKPTYEICKDIVFGIKDLFEIVVENKLEKMYIDNLINLVEENKLFFYRFAFRGITEFDNAIEEINNLRLKQRFISDNNIFTKEKMYKEIISAEEEYKKIENILKNESTILLYGAGYYASVFLELFDKNNIVGIAVSDIKQNKETQCVGVEVKQIDEYLDMRNQVYVLITTTTRYQSEIETLLRKKGFKHIICVNMSHLELLKELK